MPNITRKQLLTAQYFRFPKPLMNYLGISSGRSEADEAPLPLGWQRGQPRCLLGSGKQILGGHPSALHPSMAVAPQVSPLRCWEK